MKIFKEKKMELLNGVIPAKVIKECINDYEGYKIADDINKMALRLIFAKGIHIA